MSVCLLVCEFVCAYVRACTRIQQFSSFNDRTVSFHAYISDEPHITASQGSIIPFCRVITSTAATFNPSFRVFTARVNGDYFFIVHTDVSSDYRSLMISMKRKRKSPVRVMAAMVT